MPNLNHVSAHPQDASRTTVSLANDLPFAIKVLHQRHGSRWRAMAVMPAYTQTVLTARVGETLRIVLASADKQLTTIRPASAPTALNIDSRLLRSSDAGEKKTVRFDSPVARPTLFRIDAQGAEQPLPAAVDPHGRLTFDTTVGSIVRAASHDGANTYYWVLVTAPGQPDVLACTFRTGSGWNVEPRAGETVLFFDVQPQPSSAATSVTEPFYLVLREPVSDLTALFETGLTRLAKPIETTSSIIVAGSTPARAESLIARLVRRCESPTAGLSVTLVAARIGTGAQCAVYEKTSLDGAYCEPDADGRLPVSVAASSVDVAQIAAADTTSLRVLTSLTEDYALEGSKLESVTHYRTIVSIDDPRIEWLEVGAWEAGTKIAIDGTAYTVGPDEPARVTPSQLRRVVITADATEAGASELRLRSSTMLEHTYVTAFPDQELHEKIAHLDDGAFHSSGLASSKYSATDCSQVQTALQNISRAVLHGHSERGAGVDSHRMIDPSQMADEHWVLRADSKSGQVTYEALAAKDVQAINARATNIHDLDASVANSFWSHIGHAVSHVVVTTVDDAKHGVSQAVDTVGHALDDAGQAVADATSSAAQAAGTAAQQAGLAVASETAKDAKAVGGAISDAANTVAKGLEITLHFAEQNIPALRFVIRQAKHVAVAIRAVVEAVEVAVADFVKWLRFLFDWKDIKRTHDLLCHETVSLLDGVSNDVGKLKRRTDAFFDKLRADAEKLRGASSSTTASTSNTPSSPTHHGALEKLEWFLHLFHHHSSKASGPDADCPTSDDALIDAVTATLSRLGQDFAKFGHDAGKLISSLRQGDIHGMLAALEAFAGDLILLACDVAQGAADAFFAIVQSAIELFLEVLQFHIKIPVLDELYKEYVGAPLTPLSIASLLLAIPLTVAVKAATNQVPFAGEQGIALSTNRSASIAYLTGLGDIFSGMTGAWAVAKAAGADKDISTPSSSTSKFSVAKRIFSIVVNGSKAIYYVAKASTAKEPAASEMVLVAGTLRAVLQLVILFKFADADTARVEVGANAVYGAVKVVAGIIDASANEGLTGSILIVGGVANLVELGGYVEDPEVWAPCAVGTFMGSSAAGVLEFYRGTTLA